MKIRSFFRSMLLGLLGSAVIVGAASPEYLTQLYKLSDGLLATQITNATDKNFGALVCPSTNPDPHPTHSRSAEAVYPFAIAYKHSKDTKYSDAAIKLGNWLIKIQNAAGYWGEDWPNYDGWTGTTADQLISLAGAYVILKDKMTPAEVTAWTGSIKKSADWITANFPMGNINYTPTGAVALKFATDALPGTAAWMTKAASLMDSTVKSITSENFLFGEGKGVDLGYNIAQSIGYIALYGILTSTKTYSDKAVALLQTHSKFMYPNGAIDNSWGTRSYKWMLESGTKTAPGIEFTFALLADKDPKFNRGGQLALSFLSDHYINAQNLVVYGPNAITHPSSSPPCIYPTFARAQSLALSVEYGPDVTASAPIQAETANWFTYFTAEKTGLVRTDKIMATVTAYDGIAQYGRASVARGGSLTNVWFDGYGDMGFLQTSSQNQYIRQEAPHMPTEGALLPLTSRIEKTLDTVTYANLYDEKATLALSGTAGAYAANVTGALRKADGTSSGVTFTMIHRFASASYSKEITVSAAAGVQIVEPFVNLAGNQYALTNDSTFQITTAQGGVWQLQITSSTVSYTLAAGESKEKYWAPFPGLECYPLTIKLGSTAGSQTIKYTISQTKANTVSIRAGEPSSKYASLRATVSGRRISYSYSISNAGRSAQAGGAFLRLTTLAGKTVSVLPLEVEASKSGSGGVDVEGLKSGVYVLGVEVGGVIVSRTSVILL